jgi:hypothetical protein
VGPVVTARHLGLNRPPLRLAVDDYLGHLIGMAATEPTMPVGGEAWDAAVLRHRAGGPAPTLVAAQRWPGARIYCAGCGTEIGSALPRPARPGHPAHLEVHGAVVAPGAGHELLFACPRCRARIIDLNVVAQQFLGQLRQFIEYWDSDRGREQENNPYRRPPVRRIDV